MTAALEEGGALPLALDLIRRFEGCRLRAYRDLVGVWTIGWGETLGVAVAGVVDDDDLGHGSPCVVGVRSGGARRC